MGSHGQSASEASELLSADAVSDEEINSVLVDFERKTKENAFRRAHIIRTALAVLALLIVAAFTGFLISRDQYALQVFRANIWLILLSGILGATLGGSEIVSRYRDEPAQALRSAPALTYLGLNALVSICAYGLLTHYAKTFIPSLANDPIMRSITAGFGAMAILRSKFFTLRTEKGDDVGIGPDAAISAFLSAADRGVDRVRAKRRLDLVFESASRVSQLDYCKDSIKVSLLSLQNLGTRDMAEINKTIDDIFKDDTRYPDTELKLQAICYEVLTTVGEYNFSKLISNLVQVAARRESLVKGSQQEIAKLVRSRSADVAAPRTNGAPAAKGGSAATGREGRRK
jgi:hypothetical protein